MHFSIPELIYGATKTAITAISRKLDETVFKDLNELNKEFVESKKSNVEMPWKNDEKLKEAIFGLSADRENFTNPPPASISFDIRMSQLQSIITLLREQDPTLVKAELDLVPNQLSSETFWRNYFYHMSLLLQKQPRVPKKTESPTTVTENENNEEIKEEVNIEDIDVNDCEIEYDGENWRDAVEDLLRNESL